MGFWIAFFVSLALQVVGELLRPKQKFNKPRPSALGDFQFPTADATRVIQIFWGTCKLAGPNTVWFGDLKIVAITKKVKTGWFSSDTMTQGYKYYLGAQLVFGFGYLDELIDLQFDDKSVLGQVTGRVDGDDVYSFTLNSPTLMSAEDPQNGISGPVKLYRGSFTQMPNDYLVEQFGEPEGSGFRPLIYAVLEHCYLGNSDTPPPITLIGRRTPNPLGLTEGRHNVNGDANAANMCYEVMTSLLLGMKIPPNKIDTTAFIECGNTLAAEALGLSMVVDTAMSGKDLLAEMLRHIDGVIYPDPQTGLYTMKLARDDFDVNTLDVFDASNIDPATFEFSRMSWEDTKNTTVVTYTDRGMDFTAQPVAYQDLANVFVRKGQITTDSIEFLGFSNAAQALKVAARANKTVSSPLARLAFNTDRTGYDLRPGSVIKVSMPMFGVNELVCRVVELDYGTLDDPAVKVVCVEDIFTVNALAYSAPTGGSWTPPGGDPLPLAAERLEEAPHFGAGNDTRYVFTLATRAGAYDTGYHVWTDHGVTGTGPVQSATVYDFTPSGVLVGALAANREDDVLIGFTVTGLVDANLISAGLDADREDGRNLALIGNEIVAWRTVVDNGDGTHTFGAVLYGVLDTVLEAHAAGERAWFFSEGVGLTNSDGYTEDLYVSAYLLPYNSRGGVALDAATMLEITTDRRSLRPIAPGRVRINGARPVDIAGTVSGTFALSWAHRNRNAANIVGQSDPSIEPEANTTYSVRFYDVATTGLIIEQTGMGGAAASVSLAFVGDVRMELEAVRDGVVSRAVQSATFPYDGAAIVTSVVTADESVYILDGGRP